MSEADFRILLIAASFLAVRFGQEFVSQDLPFNFRYSVHLNQSCDDHATPEHVLYPADDGKIVENIDENDVVMLLYRSGRCPEWIDVSAHRIGPSFTELQLLCCGRFTSNRDTMYYNDRGLGPFGLKSPVLPPDYVDGQRFELPTVHVA